MDLMASGRWVSGRSHAVVAKQFEVSPRTVESWATNASRVLRLAVEGDLEEIRARMIATLETIVAEAMDYQRVVTDREGNSEAVPQADLKAAISAIDSQAKLLGLVVQKHEVAVTDEEAAKLVAEAAALAK
jgi:hypothetical protein